MSTEKIAQGLASLGRNGDSVLVHMQPNEVAGLQAIAKANGTSLTTNPHTGMPEAFSLGGMFESLLPMAAGAAMTVGSGGTISPLTAGLITGAITTAMTGDLSKGIMGGFGAYGGAGLGESLSKAGGIGSELSKQGTTMNEALDMVKSGEASPIPGGYDASGMYNASMPSAAGLKETIGNINANGPMTGSWAENAATGAKNLFKPGGFDAFKAAGGTSMQLGAPIISGALGGLEESDIYGKPIQAPNDVYDPYARLNLGGASSKGGSGLRLLAGGGPVSFASGAMVGGGTGAMEGAGSFNVDNTPAVQQAQPTGLGSQHPLLAGAWGNSSYLAGQQYQNPMFPKDMAAMGGNSLGQAAPVKLGLFATQAQIDAAKNKAMANRPMMSNPRKSYYGFGMYNNGNFGMGGWQNPNGFEGIGSLGRLPMGAPVNQAGVNPGSLNLKNLPASRLAAGGLAELQATAQGAQQPMQQQPTRYEQPTSTPQQSTITTGGNMGLYTNGDDNTQQISREGFGLTNQPGIMQQHYAKGGQLEEGAFIIPADVVSHLGNGSTDAGLAVLNKRYGAHPIRGAGDGMSDSIPTTIEGKQQARVADGEAYIPKATVMKAGGAAKFHKMMDRVRKERTGSTKQGKQINPDKLV